MKSARSLLLLLLVLWGATSSATPTISQSIKKNFRVTGYVLDVGSRRPVAGVIVGDEYWTGETSQVKTDSNGYFELLLPAVRRREKARRLIVRTVLYEGEPTVTGSKVQQVVILLRRNAFRFKPYGCQQPADSAQVVPYASAVVQGLPGTQYAFLIHDSTGRQPRKLQTIAFKISRTPIPFEPFKLRIYQYNSLDEPPGEDLLHETFNICPGRQGGVLIYDLREYDIRVSGNGFFVALEYLVGGDKFFCIDPIIGYTPTGPVLRPPCARADIRTWEYVISKGWRRATAVENCWPLYESALSVEVEPAPPAKR